MASEKPIWNRVWGEAAALVLRTRRVSWIDLVVLAGLVGIFFGLLDLARQWTGPYRATVIIDSSPWALPKYTLYSLSRGSIAYVLSLCFTLAYGYWAAKDRVAERVLIPLLDILQSIPILSFLPGFVFALVAAFPSNNIGLELASILTIFTSQAWNMTFSFYHSLRTIPQDQREVAALYRFSAWQGFKWLEVPFATVGLVWNSMMSMAGGWFFLTVSEAFQLGDKDFRLPGLGSFMKVATDEGRYDSMAWAILAMVSMIVALDQLFWRPVVVWAQKFRVEEAGQQEEMHSWFLDWLRRSRILAAAMRQVKKSRQLVEVRRPRPKAVHTSPKPKTAIGAAVSLGAFSLLVALLAYGAWRLFQLIQSVSWEVWGLSLGAAGVTLGRVLLSTALGTLWALPAGVAIGLSPRLSRIFQPVVQVIASFPAPMLFPIVIAGFTLAGIPLSWGSIVLMLMGTQWYILFNVIAGAMAIPADLREAARSYRISGWRRFWVLYFPGVFPQLVTGWVTAAGGAWNTSIVAEYVTFKGQTMKTWGLGAQVWEAAQEGNFPLLGASVLVMAVVVVGFNRTVWRRLYHLAEENYSLNK